MTGKEKLDAIRAEIHRLVDVRGYDRGMANDLFAFMDSLPNEPISKDLDEAANNYVGHAPEIDEDLSCFTKRNAFIAGAQWRKANLWKPADGDDLPEIDREVIALLSNGKVVFAHRPPEYWDGKNIATGEVTRYEPKRYDKGGWNGPNIKYWLDCELPKMEGGDV
jgi:hypothetical protein